MISREARPWPAREKEYTELLVGDYCAHGRPKKGRPVLAYFDNPPRCDTWAVLCLTRRRHHASSLPPGH
jgi:hypothetical protein